MAEATPITHKILKREGYDIHYFVSGKSDGELIMFLHPAFSDHNAFVAQLDYFSKYYKVITLDLIGHGYSQVRKSADKIDISSKHIADILEEEAYKSVHLVGVSMGSLVAQFFSFTYPNKVSSLTALGGYDIHKKNKEVTRVQFLSNLSLILRAVISMPSFRKRVAQLSTYTDEGKQIFYNSAQLYTRKSFMVMQGFQNIIDNRVFTPSYRTLILVGEYDVPLSLRMAKIWHSELKGSEYKTIEGAGHCANMDKPELFNTILKKFIVGV